MTKTILTAGVAAGLFAGSVASLFATLLSHAIPLGWGMAIGYLTMLIALSAIVVAIKRERDAAGAIGFWAALGMGVAITLIASVLYALCWEVALMRMGGPDAFMDGYLAGLRRMGGDPATLARQLRDAEAMRASYRNPMFRLPMTMTEIAPVGLLVSLVAAALLRNPRFLPARRLGAA